MRFFNIDLHISVISDLKKIFSDLGHTVDDLCLSGHADVMGRKQDRVEEISGDKWTMMAWHWQFDEFLKNHRSSLEKYDGFIVTYPPVFAMLYEKLKKPIIMHIPIRFDYGIHGKAELVDNFVSALRCGVDEGYIKIAANSKYDKRFFEMFSGIGCRHIPSLCEYTKLQYVENSGLPLVYSSEKKNADAIGGVWRHSLKRGYRWADLLKFRAMVHLPYQVSTMSIFEHYMANFPLYFPSKQCLKDMYFGGWNVLQHVSTHKLNRNANRSIHSFSGPIDPNDYRSAETVDFWLDGADYYDAEWMPHIQYFETIEALKVSLRSDDLTSISRAMLDANVKRKEKVYSMWKEVLDEIKC